MLASPLAPPPATTTTTPDSASIAPAAPPVAAAPPFAAAPLPVPDNPMPGVTARAIAPSADGSQALRALHALTDAALSIRRAQLLKVVRGVVVASALLCAAALARAAVTPSPADEPIVRLPHAGAQSRDVTPAPRLIEQVDALNASTLSALHREEHHATAHAHRWNARGRLSW